VQLTTRYIQPSEQNWLWDNMVEPPDHSRKILEGLSALFKANTSSVHFEEFLEISESMMNGYARFVKLGLPGPMIALAMLGATVNLYEMFDMRDELPELLRALANRLEDQNNPN